MEDAEGAQYARVLPPSSDSERQGGGTSPSLRRVLKTGETPSRRPVQQQQLTWKQYLSDPSEYTPQVTEALCRLLDHLSFLQPAGLAIGKHRCELTCQNAIQVTSTSHILRNERKSHTNKF